MAGSRVQSPVYKKPLPKAEGETYPALRPSRINNLLPYFSDLPSHFNDLPSHFNDQPPHFNDQPPHFSNLLPHFSDLPPPAMKTYPLRLQRQAIGGGKER